MILRYIKTYTSQFQGENFSKKMAVLTLLISFNCIADTPDEDPGPKTYSEQNSTTSQGTLKSTRKP